MAIENENNLENNQFEELIQGLIANDYGCCDDFTNLTLTSGLRNNLYGFAESGNLQSSGVGNKEKFQKNKLIRGDKIKWLEEKDENAHEVVFQQKINDFISHLNKTCYTSINKFESHYASYEKDSFYKRHLDQFKSDKGRKFSIILYLNENWQKEDGGILSLYPEGREQIDISPLGGRMVFFRSDEMEHEVQPSHTRDRISIAGWLKNE